MLQILTLITLLITIAGPIAPVAREPKTISIAEARSLPLGTIVTIDGSVTVPSGAFNSSTFEQGFAIQDRSGGIYGSTPNNRGFAPRQQVRVTGRLADTVQLELLVLVDVTGVKAHGSGPKVRPLPGIDVSGLSPGQTVEITGFSSQFADEFEPQRGTKGTRRFCAFLCALSGDTVYAET